MFECVSVPELSRYRYCFCNLVNSKMKQSASLVQEWLMSHDIFVLNRYNYNIYIIIIPRALPLHSLPFDFSWYYKGQLLLLIKAT